MTAKSKPRVSCPWDALEGSKKSKKEAWTLKKGKEAITFTKSKMDNNFFLTQKDNDRKLSLQSFQARCTFHQLIDKGYKLQK